MTPIQVQIAMPDGSTRRQVFTGPVVTFGREADNTLILAHKVTSRHHGALKIENGRWVLENLSTNGTRVNGKSVGRRPLALTSGDVVQIGDDEVFRVKIDEPAAGPGEEAPPPPDEAEAAASKARRKARMWMGLGVWVVVALFLLLFVFVKHNTAAPDKDPPELHQSEIIDAIQARPHEVPENVPLDDRKADEYLVKANDLNNRIDSDPTAVYDAYHYYQLALIYSGKGSFSSGLDELHFQDLEKRLIDMVSKQYHDGYNQFRNQNLTGAETTFQQLQRAYHDDQSPVWRNIGEILQVIRKRKDAGKHGLRL